MNNNIGIYVHIPFCRRRCRYCDFTSYDGEFNAVGDYFKKLENEMLSFERCNVDTIYFGGGTPSCIDSFYICSFLEKIYKHFNVKKDAEITIEVNPDSVDCDKLNSYKEAGINRISMGAQSFVDEELKFLGRLHDAKGIRTAYELIRKCGFDNVSLDLMFGLPNQTMENLNYSINEILKLSPEHISCYGLKIEEGTCLYNQLELGRIFPIDDDLFADMYENLCERLASKGYIQYEISNFSLKGKESKHNSRYWMCDEYIGLGAGASSYLKGVRSKNTNNLLNYKNEVEEVLTLNDKMSEFVVLGLRMTEKGINTEEFGVRFGKNIYDVFEKQLKKHSQFIIQEGSVLKLKRNAYYISNAILSDFLL